MKPAFSVLTICGIEELEAHSARGVTHVLSITDPDITDLPVFERYGPHRRTVLRFHDAIEPGPEVVLPRAEDVAAILAFGRELDPDDLAEAGHLLIHCHMGISRSSAAMTMLVAQAHPEQDEAEVADHIRSIRPIAWPNLRMITFADEMLGRDGRLIQAVGRLYAQALAARPDLAEAMTRLNRAREVAFGRSLMT